MDRQALRLIDMLNDESTDSDGNDKYDITLKLKLFQMGQDWLMRRKKLKPEGDQSAEGSGITDMRTWMNDPTVKDTITQMVFEAGFVKEPPKRRGRPRVEEREVRERFKRYSQGDSDAAPDEDDSGWKTLLEEEKK